MAKAANKSPFSAADLLMVPLKLLTPSHSSMQFVFLPGYADNGGWPFSLAVVSYALGFLATLAWPIYVLRPATRLFSLACFLGNFYLSGILRYYPPWYLPTLAVFGYLTIGLIFDQMLDLAMKLPQRGWIPLLPKLLRLSVVGLVTWQLAVTVCVARQLQVQQKLIENGLRRQIGLWLRDHARTPHDTVMLEPLGYIGYFSGLKMLDYPGLASWEMVEVRKRLGPGRENQVYLELQPDWLVLRPWEVRTGIYVDAAGRQNFYDLVRVFDATDKIHAVRWLPGRPFLEYDQAFLIDRKSVG
jgi:hypothetical protein